MVHHLGTGSELLPWQFSSILLSLRCVHLDRYYSQYAYYLIDSDFQWIFEKQIHTVRTLSRPWRRLLSIIRAEAIRDGESPSLEHALCDGFYLGCDIVHRASEAMHEVSFVLFARCLKD